MTSKKIHGEDFFSKTFKTFPKKFPIFFSMFWFWQWNVKTRLRISSWCISFVVHIPMKCVKLWNTPASVIRPDRSGKISGAKKKLKSIRNSDPEQNDQINDFSSDPAIWRRYWSGGKLRRSDTMFPQFHLITADPTKMLRDPDPTEGKRGDPVKF